MTEEKAKVDPSEWDTITGLADDVDAWIKKAWFGFKDEYASVAGMDSPMMLFSLVNEEGEEVAVQGYSCGGGWKIVDEGRAIVHDLRTKIVKTSIYGQLLDRVIKGLGVPMWEYGSPLYAPSWENLGFHWKQEEHATLDPNVKRTALMPSEYLGGMVEEGAKPGVPAKKLPTFTPAEEALKDLAKSASDVKAFQKAALKVEGVVGSDQLMASVLDESEEGLYARLKK